MKCNENKECLKNELSGFSSEKLEELNKIFDALKNCKDSESYKLYINLFRNTEGINFTDVYINTAYSINEGHATYEYSNGSKSLSELPPTVVLYLITKDESILKKCHYGLSKNGRFIYHGQNRYYVDRIFKPCDLSEIFK